MWSNKHLVGPMGPTAFLRQPAGTWAVYFLQPGSSFHAAMRIFPAKAVGIGAKVSQSGLSVIDSKHRHRLAIEVRVLQSGRAAFKPTGRPPLPESERKPRYHRPRRELRVEDFLHPSFEE